VLQWAQGFLIVNILTSTLHAYLAAAGTVLRGKLHLIDLAGSERIGRTGAQVRCAGNQRQACTWDEHQHLLVQRGQMLPVNVTAHAMVKD
jgi:hypothetical protein